jgi:hypothetical protein
MEQEIRTGDPATDREAADEMKRSYEAAGMTVEVSPLPGGGFKIRAEMAQPQAFTTPQGQTVAMPVAGSYELGGALGVHLKMMAAQGDLRPLLEHMAEARAAGDWDEQAFMAELIGKECPRPVLDQACAQMPGAAEPRVVRAAHLLQRAWDARGTGTADTITDAGAGTMVQVLDLARRDLAEAAQADPYSPVPHAMMIEVATLHEGMSRQEAQAAFNWALERHPTDLLAFRNMLRLAAKKWGGSHEEALQVARLAASRAAPGNDVAGCLFHANIEIWFYHKQFEENEAAAAAYLADPQVRGELDRAFDAWLAPGYLARAVSPPQLHLTAFWYFLVGDLPRLKRAVAAINMVPVSHPWHYLGEPTMMWTTALQRAM